MVVWIVGLSGSGKTTLAQALQDRFRKEGKACVLVDGDRVRELFGNDLGYAIEDRRKNADRIHRLCKFLADEKIHVICAILSIVPEMGERNRNAFGDYFEVFLDAPLPLLIERDNKQLYGGALKGSTSNVVGIDIPFPRPVNYDYLIQQRFDRSPAEAADEIFGSIVEKLG